MWGAETSVRGYVHQEMIFPGNKGSNKKAGLHGLLERQEIGSEGGWPQRVAGGGREELEPRRGRAGLAEPC